MFEMNPLNLPDAQMQQWIMLFVAGTLGFIIGYSSRQQAIRHLEGGLASTTRELDDCLNAPAPLTVAGSADEMVVLNRIAARSKELNFHRIGYAVADEADDLKIIVGIGPFLEKKLNAIGIYTFRQIANFNQDDIYLVNDVIEFFPGRIERENWVGQSVELAKNK
jgi:predicted flap endonuclease-1-like 5' DNA nuclease